MDNIQDKLYILLEYWIKHNSEHEKEFRDWADKIALLSTEVAQRLQEAAIKMSATNNDLVEAKQALTKGKRRY